MSLAADDPRHGTTTGYGYHRCRCDACRAASAEYHRANAVGGYRRDACACGKPKRPKAARCRTCYDAARAPTHGSEGRYRLGCRCDLCCAARPRRYSKGLAPDDPRHGTYTGYANHRCRCDRCRAANTDYQRASGTGGYKRDACACGKPKAAKAARCRTCEDAAREAPHGTASRYRRCRCDLCRAAGTAARRAHRLRAGAAA